VQEPLTKPEEAIRRLSEGNASFRTGRGLSAVRPWNPQRSNAPQRPFAIVLACSDSRVPVESLFDQGIGELFVVRVAGNIVDTSVIGSVEFAVAYIGCSLVVVMGHTQCGAVAAAVDALEGGTKPTSDSIRLITDRITPHIADLLRSGSWTMRDVGRANTRGSADNLRRGSELLDDFIRKGQVQIVEAEYELETGEVHFF
jgi:carbonic anhydrase